VRSCWVVKFIFLSCFWMSIKLILSCVSLKTYTSFGMTWFALYSYYLKFQTRRFSLIISVYLFIFLLWHSFVVTDNEDGVCTEACGDGHSLLCIVCRSRGLGQNYHHQNARLHRILRRIGWYKPSSTFLCFFLQLILPPAPPKKSGIEIGLKFFHAMELKFFLSLRPSFSV